MRSRHCATIRRVGAAVALGGIGLAILFRSRSATAATRPYAMPSDWKPAKLTEYYPDLPPSASAAERRLEGGSNSRSPLIPVITLDQHRKDPVRYPFATVAADIVLEGRPIKVGYGPRLYLKAYPNDTFRIYDTGGSFINGKKKIGDVEPFDIAVSYSGLRGTIGDRVTLYRVDWSDVLAFPQRLKRQSNA